MNINIKSFLDKIIRGNILSVFIFFAALMGALGIVYYSGLDPSENEIQAVVSNFTVGDYSIPYQELFYKGWFHHLLY